VFFLSVGQVTAVPETEQDDIWHDGQSRSKYRRRELTDERIEQVIAQLKESEPEKATELEKLRKEDAEKFRDELRKVMRDQFSRRRRERAGESEQRHDRGSSFGRGGRGSWMRERYAEYTEWLEKNYPEAMKKVAESKEEDPELYQKKLGLTFRKYRRIFEASKENPKLEEVLKADLEVKEQRRGLLKKIRATKDKNEKAQLMGELEMLVGRRFDLLVEKKEIEYASLLEKLAKLQKEIEKSKSKVEKWKVATFKEENIKARIERLLSRKSQFKWE